MSKKNCKKENMFINDEKQVKEWTDTIVEQGESLGEAFMRIIDGHTQTPEGYGVVTFALAKAWASVQAAATVSKIPVEPLFREINSVCKHRYVQILKDQLPCIGM